MRRLTILKGGASVSEVADSVGHSTLFGSLTLTYYYAA